MERWWTQALENWANQIAARYGFPVYLVGSSVEGGAASRDCDVVCILPNEDFEARFGSSTATYSMITPWPERTQRLWAEIGKMSAQGSRLTGLNIDFKVQAVRDAGGHGDRPRVRLDTLELEEVFRVCEHGLNVAKWECKECKNA